MGGGKLKDFNYNVGHADVHTDEKGSLIMNTLEEQKTRGAE